MILALRPSRHRPGFIPRGRRGAPFSAPLEPVCLILVVAKGTPLVLIYRLENLLKAPSSPPVELSCPLPAPGSSISLRIFLARTLPSSTPHWSKLLMSQTAPSVKVRCS